VSSKRVVCVRVRWTETCPKSATANRERGGIEIDCRSLSEQVCSAGTGKSDADAAMALVADEAPAFQMIGNVRDGGKFPPGAMDDLDLVGQDVGVKKAGILPHLALAGGLAIVLTANWIFQLPA